MNKKLFVILALTVTASSLIGIAEAQEPEPEIAFSEFQITVFGIGALAGLVSAYNGYSKNKSQKGTEFKFDRRAFLDRVLMAILGSLPLAIAESANVIKLDLFGAWVIFSAALGTSQLIMEVRNRNKTK